MSSREAKRETLVVQQEPDLEFRQRFAVAQPLLPKSETMPLSSRSTPPTARRIRGLLTPDERFNVRVAETAALLAAGEEYIDLALPELGVQQTSWMITSLVGTLPKKSVSPSTWERIVRLIARPKRTKT
jgi:hypothetical protein